MKLNIFKCFMCSCALLYTIHLWTPSAYATMIAYKTDRELFQESDLVVLGRVLRQQTLWINDFLYTEYELEITESIKGHKPAGSYVIVRSLGGEDPNTHLFEDVAGSPHPKVDDDHILFLKKNRDTSAYMVHSMALGHFDIQYDIHTKRYFAHRATDTLVFIKTSITRDEQDSSIIVPPFTHLSVLMNQLRSYAQSDIQQR